MPDAKLLLRMCAVLLTLAASANCQPVAEPTQSVASESASGDLAGDDLQLALLQASDSLISTVNSRRAEAGALPLLSHPTLTEMAFERATDMAVRGYLGHEDPETGTTILEVELADQGFSGPAAELLFETEGSLESVVDLALASWWDDPAHKALLLEPAFRFAGAGLMGDGKHWRLALILVVQSPQGPQP